MTARDRFLKKMKEPKTHEGSRETPVETLVGSNINDLVSKEAPIKKLNEALLDHRMGKDFTVKKNSIGKKVKNFHHIGDIGEHKVYWRENKDENHDFVMAHKNGIIHTHLNTNLKARTHHINMVQSDRSGPGVHHLYHHLINKHNLAISTHHQSPGGYKIWQKLSKMDGVHVHGRSGGKRVHVNMDDHSSTHSVVNDDGHWDSHDNHIANIKLEARRS